MLCCFDRFNLIQPSFSSRPRLPDRAYDHTGSYTLIFATCIYIIHTKRVALHRLLTSTAIISFALSTVCIVINTYKMYSGYSAVPGGGGAVLSYVPSDPNDTTNHAKDYVFNINVSLAPDALLVLVGDDLRDGVPCG